MDNIKNNLLNWYYQNGRKDLPWRRSISAYRIWLSEIMLQQTQVATVIPYFKKFIRQFPIIKKLALAHEDEVLHLWSGLGYYSRARNLHKTAKIIVADFKGRFPKDVDQLQQLPGIGRSTAGAIAALAYDQPAPILDGNVKRVLARLYAIKGWPGTTATQKKLWRLAETHTPLEDVHDYTQAIMDLGAMVCVRNNPLCGQCPLVADCKAFATKKQNHFPESKPKKVIPEKSVYMLIIKNSKDEILLEKRPPVGIWGGLWSLPECDVYDDIGKYCREKFGFKINKPCLLKSFRHTFSHFHLDIQPVVVRVCDRDLVVMEGDQQCWYQGHENLGMAAAVRKILLALDVCTDRRVC